MNEVGGCWGKEWCKRLGRMGEGVKEVGDSRGRSERGGGWWGKVTMK